MVGKKVKKRMGQGTCNSFETAFVHITVFPKDDSDIGFAYAYWFKRNRVKVILKGQGENLHLVLSYDATVTNREVKSLAKN